MISLKVVIQSKEMAEQGHKIAEVHPEDMVEAENVTVGILEGGMQSGATSVMIVHELPDGSVTIGQCSAKQIHALSKAIKGAQKRWGDNSFPT